LKIGICRDLSHSKEWVFYYLERIRNMAFAQIYTCSEHGETIHPEKVESIDTENDEVYVDWVCSQCYRTVERLMIDGKPVLRPLTDNEMFWESFTGEF
jgi:hypothetical protein